MNFEQMKNIVEKLHFASSHDIMDYLLEENNPTCCTIFLERKSSRFLATRKYDKFVDDFMEELRTYDCEKRLTFGTDELNGAYGRIFFYKNYTVVCKIYR